MSLTSGLKKRLAAKGVEGVHGRDALLDNDDIRPLALKDRTWTTRTYFTFWFSAVATGNNCLQSPSYPPSGDTNDP